MTKKTEIVNSDLLGVIEKKKETKKEIKKKTIQGIDKGFITKWFF